MTPRNEIHSMGLYICEMFLVAMSFLGVVWHALTKRAVVLGDTG